MVAQQPMDGPVEGSEETEDRSEIRTTMYKAPDLDLGELSEEERRAIEDVVQRDSDLRNEENEKIDELKREITDLMELEQSMKTEQEERDLAASAQKNGEQSDEDQKHSTDHNDNEENLEDQQQTVGVSCGPSGAGTRPFIPDDSQTSIRIDSMNLDEVDDDELAARRPDMENDLGDHSDLTTEQKSGRPMGAIMEEMAAEENEMEGEEKEEEEEEKKNNKKKMKKQKTIFDTNCVRCRKKFGWIYDRGAVCRNCSRKVCKKCRHLVTTKSQWLCSICFKRLELYMWCRVWLTEKELRELVETGIFGIDLNDMNLNLENGIDIADGETGSMLFGQEMLLSDPERDTLSTDHVERILVRRQRDLQKPSFPIEEIVGFREALKAKKIMQKNSSMGMSTDSADTFGTIKSNTSLGLRPQSFRSSGSQESLSSDYSSMGRIDYGRIPAQGEIEVGMSYFDDRKQFVILVNQCRDIAAVDTKNNTSNPYVKAYLLPAKSNSGKRKTKIKKGTLCPVFNEPLPFEIDKDDLRKRTAWLSVWHSGSLAKNEYLGEVMIPLSDYNFHDPAPRFYKLWQGRAEKWKSALTLIAQSDVTVSIKLSSAPRISTSTPKKEDVKGNGVVGKDGYELHVHVKGAKNLTAMKSKGGSNIFYKCLLLPEGPKKKSKVIKDDLNPKWDKVEVFPRLQLDSLSNQCLEITLWDHNRMSSSDFLGGIRLSKGTGMINGHKASWLESSPAEVEFWQAVISSPNKWFERVLPLKAQLDG